MLKRGDILAVHSKKSPIGWLVRQVTDSYWNHVAWVLDENTIVEAGAMIGVEINPINRYNIYDPTEVKVLRIKPGLVSQSGLDSAIDDAKSMAGSHYDWWLIVQLLWLYLTGRIRKVNADDNEKWWICSEIIAKLLWKRAGFKFDDNIPPQNITPAHIVNSSCLEEVLLCQQSG